jgi:FkbM family methyltransferase
LNRTTTSLLAVIATDPGESHDLLAFRTEWLTETLGQHAGPFGPVEIRTVPRSDLGALTLPSEGWIFVLMPGDVPIHAIFEHVAVALDGYDAVWGAALYQKPGAGSLTPIAETALGCSTLDKLLFRSPEFWLTRSFFIRASAARDVHAAAWHTTDALLDQWRAGSATKLALPFVVCTEVRRDQQAWADVLDYVRRRPLIEQVSVDGTTLAFRIAYWNPYLESFLVSGRLFEDSQLFALKRLIPPGATIVDVGANIGQHTIFFAKIMKARCVVALEPNPEFAAVLRENVALNELDNVDLSRLGMAVGARRGHARVAPSDNPQDTLIVPDDAGPLPVVPLDALVTGPIDLVKIDVDEQEIAVLEGMGDILRTRRPVLAIEVVHRNLADTLGLLSRFDYRVDHVFSNPQYHDIVAVPD